MSEQGFTYTGRRVALCTLGCKLNFAETSFLGQALLERGMILAEEGESADLVLVNTCSVTSVADRKSRQLIRRAHRDHPDAVIVVTGCSAQLQPQRYAKLPGVDLVLGAKEKGALLHYLDHLSAIDTVEVSPYEEATTFVPSVSSEGRTRHFLKVQDGCDYCCSYCTIPFARGHSRSGEVSDLVRRAEQVAAHGGREIVLTGVNVGDFGRDTGSSFLRLLEALDSVEGIDRFRISSIEPNLITDEIIDFVRGSKRFAPHFHIPLQSGSDKVLRLMRRRYRREVFAHKVELIHELMPDAYIGVDVIVGMRGEEEADFEESAAFIAGLPVSKLHVFPYSERKGTAALRITPVVSPEEKHRRAHRLITISDHKLSHFTRSQVGSERRLLVEEPEEQEWLHGYTENYLRVRIPYQPGLVGEVVKVRADHVVPGHPDLVEGILI